MDPRRGWLGSVVERVHGSRLVNRGLGVAGALAAEVQIRRGDRLRAADTLLETWRLVGEEGVGTRAIRRLQALVREACFDEGRLVPLERNRFLRRFTQSEEGRAIRRRWARYPVADRVRLRKPRPHGDPLRQGNLMVAKPFNAVTGEKGVLFVMYTESLDVLPVVFDLPRLVSSYMLVLEPSWWGYQDRRILSYMGDGADVAVLAQSRPDYEFIRWLDGNLMPSRIGAGDWADPEQFHPKRDETRRYDVVMVSAWDPFKRHEVLLRALRKLKDRRGRSLKAALVGYPLRWDATRIRRLVRRYGLQEDCAVFDSLPHERVAEIVSDARAMVLLSRREGANRALYESLFCDTPIVVYRHHRGVNLDHVTGETGRLADDNELADVLLDVVDHPAKFSPRRWALAHTGWEVSTRALNDLLRNRARERSQPWTRDIAARKNAPNLQYANEADERALRGEYEVLRQYLHPEASS